MKKEMRTVLEYSYMGNEIIKYIEQLENALDRSCEELENLEYHYCLFDYEYAESNLHHKGRSYSNKEEWKERFLKNE